MRFRFGVTFGGGDRRGVVPPSGREVDFAAGKRRKENAVRTVWDYVINAFPSGGRGTALAVDEVSRHVCPAISFAVGIAVGSDNPVGDDAHIVPFRTIWDYVIPSHLFTFSLWKEKVTKRNHWGRPPSGIPLCRFAIASATA